MHVCSSSGPRQSSTLRRGRVDRYASVTQTPSLLLRRQHKKRTRRVKEDGKGHDTQVGYHLDVRVYSCLYFNKMGNRSMVPYPVHQDSPYIPTNPRPQPTIVSSAHLVARKMDDIQHPLGLSSNTEATSAETRSTLPTHILLFRRKHTPISYYRGRGKDICSLAYRSRDSSTERYLSDLNKPR
jgi:hypothetical protein